MAAVSAVPHRPRHERVELAGPPVATPQPTDPVVPSAGGLPTENLNGQPPTSPGKGPTGTRRTTTYDGRSPRRVTATACSRRREFAADGNDLQHMNAHGSCPRIAGGLQYLYDHIHEVPAVVIPASKGGPFAQSWPSRPEREAPSCPCSGASCSPTSVLFNASTATRNCAGTGRRRPEVRRLAGNPLPGTCRAVQRNHGGILRSVIKHSIVEAGGWKWGASGWAQLC